MSMWRPLASPCTFLSGWWMEGACRLPSWLAQSHKNHPKKLQVCANSPCRAQTHAHTQTRGRVPGLAGERLGAAGASAAAGCRLARQKGQTRGKGKWRPSRPSPRPGRGAGEGSANSSGRPTCKQQDPLRPGNSTLHLFQAVLVAFLPFYGERPDAPPPPRTHGAGFLCPAHLRDSWSSWLRTELSPTAEAPSGSWLSWSSTSRPFSSAICRMRLSTCSCGVVSVVAELMESSIT